MPGEGDRYRYRPTGRSIIAVLTGEHAALRELSERLVAQASADRHLAQVLTAAVTRHLSAEEQYLYPTLRALLPNGDTIADAEIANDTALLRQLAVLETKQPGSRFFMDLAQSIHSMLLTHEQTCATRLFPQLAKLAGEADLVRLGNRIEVAEEAAPTRPHPGTPNRPPWNKVVDPAVGTIDRLRDGAEHRKTLPEDL